MDRTTDGWLSGFAGVLVFSGSLPATRVAIGDIDPLFLTLIRAAIAGAIGLALLATWRQPRPERRDLRSLIIVALGVVVGFPLLSALALEHMSAGRSIVFTGLLPLATAGFAVLRGGERPDRRFWLFALLGSLLIAGFALMRGTTSSLAGDLLMLAAILVCGLGYAEGAVLSRRLGGWQVICWALALALPVMLGMLCLLPWPTWSTVGLPAWIGLGYVSLFSMLIGFMFWYRGLALGGTAAVGQLQLFQPLFGLGLAATLLHESIGPGMIVTTLAVVACVAGARHFSTRRIPSDS
ncbi:MAG: DMT family transporter [Pseudomonadota bacterium]